MPEPVNITGLVERYRKGLLNTTEAEDIGRNFIEPVLYNLGWDTIPSGGSIKRDSWIMRNVLFRTSGRMQYVDYVLCTRKGGVLAIKLDSHPREAGAALNLRRFAWNSGVKLAILTNFGESAVYDTTIPVWEGDDDTTALIASVTFDQYIGEWERITSIFSRDNVLRGSIERLLNEKGISREVVAVGTMLRADIEAWRLLLAKRIALHCHRLSADAINELVQYLLIRILFLRIAEDWGIGQYGLLMRVTEGGSAYGRLCGLFKFAGDEYGGSLFRFGDADDQGEPPDTLTLGLPIDDETVKKIITRLSSRESPYEFSVIRAEVLAEVFSAFLGSVIRIAAGYQAVVEERSEVLMSDSNSGTPREIAEYMVDRTLSGLVNGKSPPDIPDLHVVDPACSSGMFLIMAYEYLLDWHFRWYVENLVPILKCGTDNPGDFQPESWGGGFGNHSLPVTCCRGIRGGSLQEKMTWRLTPGERARILCSMISGVDIDRRAVLTTRFLLLVKLIEDEGGIPLPDLSATIRWGNSLVASDIFFDPDASLIDPRSRQRLLVFDWEKAFPSVMAQGGFDAVIGHLPGMRLESVRGEKEYLEKRYTTFPGTKDLYHCFVERGISLLRPEGLFSAILPDTWLRADSGAKLRAFLEKVAIREIIDLGTGTRGIPHLCMIRVQKDAPGSSVSVVRGEVRGTLTFEEYLEAYRYTIPRDRLSRKGWNLSDTRVSDLVRKIQVTGTPLGEYVMGAIDSGIRIRSAFVIDQETKKRLIDEDPGSAAVLKPLLSCEGLKRYLPPDSTKYLIVIPPEKDMRMYPAVLRHIRRHKKKEYRSGEQKQPEVTPPDAGISPELFSKQKIVFPKISRKGRFTLDPSGHYLPDSCRFIRSSSPYLLGILNSRLIWFFIRQTVPPFRGDYRKFCGRHFENIPIFVPDFDHPGDTSWHDSLEALVMQMIGIQKRAAETDNVPEKDRYREQIRELDERIDMIVCDLYALTPEERLVMHKETADWHPSR
jgi:hypothetical protein